jgi:hypothetical protein
MSGATGSSVTAVTMRCEASNGMPGRHRRKINNAMSVEYEVLNEIYKLIDEQMATLSGKLTPEEAKRYASRRTRIAELVGKIAANGSGTNSSPEEGGRV